MNQIFTCDVVNCVQFCDFLSNCQCNDGSTHLALFVDITVSDLDHSSLSQQYQNCCEHSNLHISELSDPVETLYGLFSIQTSSHQYFMHF